jgi:hypothetical protein
MLLKAKFSVNLRVSSVVLSAIFLYLLVEFLRKGFFY